MLRKWFNFIIVIALLGLIYGVADSFYRPNLEKLYVKLDKWGITELGRNEIQRKDTIMELNIPIAQREALINRTIFFGASKDMVVLALGNPFSKSPPTQPGEDVWIYHFDEYDRPTYLYFEKDVLVSAKKP